MANDHISVIETNQHVTWEATEGNRVNASILPPLVGTSHYAAAPNSIALRLQSAASLGNAHTPSTSLLTAPPPATSPAMASFPFDPTPLLPPPNHQRIDVPGRPARIKILSGTAPPTLEEWVVATIVSKPNLPVQLNTIREVLADFLTDIKHVGFFEISPCPFGQAYVKLDSVFDRDELVNNSPHLFTDVHVIFEKHNKGLNWRRLTLNREV